MNLSDEYEPEIFGELGTDTFRVFFKKKLQNAADEDLAKIYITPFHDIPLYSELGPNIHRMIVRIPRWSNARMEICKEEAFNPIKHESTRQKLRYYENIFPYHGVLWNYGSFPQTWEMSSFVHPDFKDLKSDNNLLDVIEIGSRIHQIGTVLNVKILGAIVLIEQDHLDWKIISLDVNDPLASKIDDINDIDIHMPGLLDATLEYFRFYKVGLGNPPIDFEYGKCLLDKSQAQPTIERSHKFWNNLLKDELYFKNSKDSADFKLFNTQCLEGNKEFIRNSKEAEALIDTLRSSIMNRPGEAMAQPPPAHLLEKVIYLNKQQYLSSKKNKEEERLENSELVEVERNFLIALGDTIKKNFFLIGMPLCLITAGIVYTIKKSKI